MSAFGWLQYNAVYDWSVNILWNVLLLIATTNQYDISIHPSQGVESKNMFYFAPNYLPLHSSPICYSLLLLFYCRSWRYCGCCCCCSFRAFYVNLLLATFSFIHHQDRNNPIYRRWMELQTTTKISMENVKKCPSSWQNNWLVNTHDAYETLE